MKRLIAAILIMLAALAFGACAKGKTPSPTDAPEKTDAPEPTAEPDPADELAGRWTLNSKVTLGEMDDDRAIEFEAALAHGFDMSLTLGEDGSGTMTVKNGEVVTETVFTYRIESGMLFMETGDGLDARRYELEYGHLYLWKDGWAMAFDRIDGR